MSALLEVRGLAKRFASRAGREPSPWIIQNLSFSVNEGEFLTIIGPSGGGKSTLLRVLMGLEQIDRGSVVFGGKPYISADGSGVMQRAGSR